MIDIDYYCTRCGRYHVEGGFICPECGGDVKGHGFPGTSGLTRNFKAMKTHEGKEVSTWKQWERAGYRDAKDFHSGKVLDGIKRKEEKIKMYDTKKRFSVMT